MQWMEFGNKRAGDTTSKNLFFPSCRSMITEFPLPAENFGLNLTEVEFQFMIFDTVIGIA